MLYTCEVLERRTATFPAVGCKASSDTFVTAVLSGLSAWRFSLWCALLSCLDWCRPWGYKSLHGKGSSLAASLWRRSQARNPPWQRLQVVDLCSKVKSLKWFWPRIDRSWVYGVFGRTGWPLYHSSWFSVCVFHHSNIGKYFLRPKILEHALHMTYYLITKWKITETKRKTFIIYVIILKQLSKVCLFPRTLVWFTNICKSCALFCFWFYVMYLRRLWVPCSWLSGGRFQRFV